MNDLLTDTFVPRLSTLFPLLDGHLAVAEPLHVRVDHPGPRPRLWPFRVLVAGPLPVRRLQQIDLGGEHVLRRTPPRRLTNLRLHRRRTARQVHDEAEQPPPRAGDELGAEVEVVEALEVGLYRSAVLG